jgi:hypothetical protein
MLIPIQFIVEPQVPKDYIKIEEDETIKIDKEDLRENNKA